MGKSGNGCNSRILISLLFILICNLKCKEILNNEFSYIRRKYESNQMDFNRIRVLMENIKLDNPKYNFYLKIENKDFDEFILIKDSTMEVYKDENTFSLNSKDSNFYKKDRSILKNSTINYIDQIIKIKRVLQINKIEVRSKNYISIFYKDNSKVLLYPFDLTRTTGEFSCNLVSYNDMLNNNIESKLPYAIKLKNGWLCLKFNYCN